MGFVGSGGINNSASDDDDIDGEKSSPIEMTAVNRKKLDGQRKKKAKGRKRQDSSSEESGQGRQLELFDQDEEDGSQQKAPGGAKDYNPFDGGNGDSAATNDQGIDLLQMDSEVAGHALVNEIDDALGGDSDDDGDEFGSFV